MQIGFTYDLREDYLARGFTAEEAAEFDSAATVDAIYAALQATGHQVERIGDIRRLATRLVQGARWDIVFNICEGFSGMGREAQVPALLDAYEIPYTFSGPDVLCLTLDKPLARLVVAQAGLAVAPGATVRTPADIAAVAARLPFPLFAKPAGEGSSKGIDQQSLVRSAAELEATCRRLLADFRQPVLVEEYLPGREFTVGIIGEQVLGVLEMEPSATGDSAGHTFGNKQQCETRMRYSLADDATGRAAARLALDCWQALGCQDGGRIDIRCDASGLPCFLEANPLPGLNPEVSDLLIINRMLGRSHARLVQDILESRIRRGDSGGK